MWDIKGWNGDTKVKIEDELLSIQNLFVLLHSFEA